MSTEIESKLRAYISKAQSLAKEYVDAANHGRIDILQRSIDELLTLLTEEKPDE